MNTRQLGLDFLKFLQEYDEAWKLVQTLQDRNDKLTTELHEVQTLVNALSSRVITLESKLTVQQWNNQPLTPNQGVVGGTPILPLQNVERAFEGELSGVIQSVLSNKLTNDDVRSSLVAQAQKDINSLVASHRGLMNVSSNFYHWMRYDPSQYSVSFIDDVKSRQVIARITWKHNNAVVATGTAQCAPEDTFNAHIGRVIALYRAFLCNVPSVYFHVPNPSKIMKGQEVRLKAGTFKSATGIVEGIYPAVYATTSKEVAQIEITNRGDNYDTPRRLRAPLHLLQVVNDTALF